MNDTHPIRQEPLLEMRDACVDYRLNAGLFGRGTLRAVDDVSLSLLPGEALAMVGESGSGKSTLGRLMTGELSPSSGSALIGGRPISSLNRLHRARLVQPVVQNPSAAFDPRWTIRRLLEEPITIHRDLAPGGQSALEDILAATRLPPALLDRFPHELSGGQLQRVAIARALLLKPKLLVCDEAVSALDAVVQLEIVALLNSVRREFNTAIVFITHDLHVVPRVADRTAVMYLGRVVETGPVDGMGSAHSHPYTRALYGSAPRNGRRTGRRATLAGEPPNPAEKPSGCAFHPRCALAVAACSRIVPAAYASGNRCVSCHLAAPAAEVERRAVEAVS